MKVLKIHPFILLILTLTILSFPHPANALTVEVNTAAQLQAEVSAANQRGGNTIILLNDGVYTLSSGLSITAPSITLQGKSRDRSKVTVEGDAMSPTATVGSLISVWNSDNGLIENCLFEYSAGINNKVPVP